MDAQYFTADIIWKTRENRLKFITFLSIKTERNTFD